MIIERLDLTTGERHRDVYEVTPAPEPGRERAVLAELVCGIHPGAVERSYSGCEGVFRDDSGEITAVLRASDPPLEPPRHDDQARLFEA